jgi:hypothetical protein
MSPRASRRRATAGELRVRPWVDLAVALGRLTAAVVDVIGGSPPRRGGGDPPAGRLQQADVPYRPLSQEQLEEACAYLAEHVARLPDARIARERTRGCRCSPGERRWCG